jgi:hypothetical protein
VESDRLSAPNDGREARRVSELFVCSGGDWERGRCGRRRVFPPTNHPTALSTATDAAGKADGKRVRLRPLRERAAVTAVPIAAKVGASSVRPACRLRANRRGPSAMFLS